MARPAARVETTVTGAASGPLPELETPSVIVDRERLLRNIRRVRGIAERHGLRLRPHIKTHKSVEIAHLQLEEGAFGVTASKPDEALVFIRAGVPSVTVAYPLVDPRKLDRLLIAAADRGTDLRLIADSLRHVELIDDAASRCDGRAGVFLKVDVGLGRVGVEPTSPMALEVARAIADRFRLDFRGLLAHAGHAYAASDPDEIARIAEDERRTLLTLADRLKRHGLTVPEVSVGSTPTVLAAGSFEGLTEIRPGNYVFLDMTAVRLGVATLDDVALTVLATVVSRNDRYAVVDAGSKVLSSDQGPHATGHGVGFGRAFPGRSLEGPGLVVERLSEEHGLVRHGGTPLAVGDRLSIVPNHACVVTNLVGEVYVAHANAVSQRWPMQAQSCVL